MTEFNQYSKSDISEASFLITGGAGFIGCNILKELIRLNARKVVILDNLSTGFMENISEFLHLSSVHFIEGDIRDEETCNQTCKGIDFVLHHAALGSIPRSIDNPQLTNSVNVNGFLNMLNASRLAGVKRFIYASSSSVYGDDPSMPKVEEKTGRPLSPYAVTKVANELYAEVFGKTYGMEIIGLRYFNVFGPKQNISGPYAAVIPIFIRQLLNQKECTIFGDGKNTRDFTFVSNVVHAVLLAATSASQEATGKVYNIACGESISILDIYIKICENLGIKRNPVFAPIRKGDITNSLATISKAKKYMNYLPQKNVEMGIVETIAWYQKHGNL